MNDVIKWNPALSKYFTYNLFGKIVQISPVYAIDHHSYISETLRFWLKVND